MGSYKIRTVGSLNRPLPSSSHPIRIPRGLGHDKLPLDLSDYQAIKLQFVGLRSPSISLFWPNSGPDEKHLPYYVESTERKTIKDVGPFEMGVFEDVPNRIMVLGDRPKQGWGLDLLTEYLGDPGIGKPKFGWKYYLGSSIVSLLIGSLIYIIDGLNLNSGIKGTGIALALTTTLTLFLWSQWRAEFKTFGKGKVEEILGDLHRWKHSIR